MPPNRSRDESNFKLTHYPKKTLVKNFTMGQFCRRLPLWSCGGLAFPGTGVGSILMKVILAILLFCASANGPIGAAQPEENPGQPKLEAAPPRTEADLAHQEEAMPLHPVAIGHIAGFPITNSMLVTWIVA